MIAKLVSGGQTGVDRAGLDAAMALGIDSGGWCPQGRRAEDVTIPARYRLQETPSADYRQRTEWNVRDSDATLILTRGEPSGGTALTRRLADAYARPCLVVDLVNAPDPQTVRDWIDAAGVRVLNVAGPRESGCPGIGAQARAFLEQCLAD
jgi:hypothetical protein